MVGAFVAGAASALIGVALGQGLRFKLVNRKVDGRIDQLEACLPHLITRAEVQNAFAEVAQIEAQRMQQERAVRRPEVPMPSQAVQTSQGMNQRINEQLDQLKGRIQAMNDSMMPQP